MCVGEGGGSGWLVVVVVVLGDLMIIALPLSETPFFFFLFPSSFSHSAHALPTQPNTEKCF